MKNKREVILDFTSLLDVVMLILFFFVIFAQLDTADALSKAEETQCEAQNKLEIANEKNEQANEELERLQRANALAESIIINGTSEFEEALRLKLVLTRNDANNWKLTVNSLSIENGEQIYTEIGIINDVRDIDPSEIADKINTVIVEYDYSVDDAFLCDIMLDSSEPGSNKTKQNIDNAIQLLQNEHKYQYMFVSITDLSYLEVQ